MEIIAHYFQSTQRHPYVLLEIRDRPIPPYERLILDMMSFMLVNHIQNPSVICTKIKTVDILLWPLADIDVCVILSPSGATQTNFIYIAPIGSLIAHFGSSLLFLCAYGFYGFNSILPFSYTFLSFTFYSFQTHNALSSTYKPMITTCNALIYYDFKGQCQGLLKLFASQNKYYLIEKTTIIIRILKLNFI